MSGSWRCRPLGEHLRHRQQACRYFEMLRCGGTLRVTASSLKRPCNAVGQSAFTELDSVIKLPIQYGLGFMLGNPS